MKKILSKGKNFFKNLDNGKKNNDEKSKEDKKLNEDQIEEKNIKKPPKTYLKSESFFQIAQSLIINNNQIEEKIKNVNFSIFYNQPYNSISKVLKEYLDEKGKIEFLSENVQNIYNVQFLKRKFLTENPIFCIAIVGFHHKRGSEVKFFNKFNFLHNNNFFCNKKEI